MSTDPPRAANLPPRAASPPPPPSTFSNILNHRPKARVTTEYDSDSGVLFHKLSFRVLNSLAKLKLTLQNNAKGEVSDPRVAVSSKHFSVEYDVEEREAVVRTEFGVAKGLRFSGAHNLKAQQGEIAMAADLAGPDFKLQLSTDVPSIGMPRATLKFPLGEVSLEEKDVDEEETKKVLLMNGILRGQFLNGLCTALYKDDTLNLRYSYKDAQMTFIPTITLPSNAISVAFKRRFGPSDKLSYWYNFDNDTWSSVYKHTVGKDYKFKAGYDSDVRLGWASLWVGDEAGKAKTAPMKMKVQFMLQVPQDDIESSALMFRVKKRWDI